MAFLIYIDRNNLNLNVSKLSDIVHGLWTSIWPNTRLSNANVAAKILSVRQTPSPSASVAK